jgi:hypothetical protein
MAWFADATSNLVIIQQYELFELVTAMDMFDYSYVVDGIPSSFEYVALQQTMKDPKIGSSKICTRVLELCPHLTGGNKEVKCARKLARMIRAHNLLGEEYARTQRLSRIVLIQRQWRKYVSRRALREMSTPGCKEQTCMACDKISLRTLLATHMTIQCCSCCAVYCPLCVLASAKLACTRCGDAFSSDGRKLLHKLSAIDFNTLARPERIVWSYKLFEMWKVTNNGDPSLRTIPAQIMNGLLYAVRMGHPHAQHDYAEMMLQVAPPTDLQERWERSLVSNAYTRMMLRSAQLGSTDAILKLGMKDDVLLEAYMKTEGTALSKDFLSQTFVGNTCCAKRLLTNALKWYMMGAAAGDQKCQFNAAIVTTYNGKYSEALGLFMDAQRDLDECDDDSSVTDIWLFDAESQIHSCAFVAHMYSIGSGTGQCDQMAQAYTCRFYKKFAALSPNLTKEHAEMFLVHIEALFDSLVFNASVANANASVANANASVGWE